MAELPILFSGPMVRAILREIEKPGTGKTQTRRLIKPQPKTPFYSHAHQEWRDARHSPTQKIGAIRISAGDRLYVREHWRVSQKWDETAPRDLPVRTITIFCEAGGSIANQASGKWEPDNAYPPSRPEWVGKHRQAMHMPKWASRITLIVEGVKAERLQDCSEEDAIAEGATLDAGNRLHPNYRMAYSNLWDEINGPGSWEANPWVVAYSFRPVLGNIDQIGGAA